jgi:CRISPR system Cascade subunit CasA
MNLLEEAWIPVRRASGQRERISPHDLTMGIDTDPIVAVDAPRPDFNGALIQFLIGLVQTAWVHGDKHWDREDMLWSPPTPQELASVFGSLKSAFDLDGDGPRFMQDLTLSPAESPADNEISALLIEFPGTQALERNTDHFVKRTNSGAMCSHCAATALHCLMTNAPSGGAGHRTSIRGGGPLSTLVVYQQADQKQPFAALWRDIACNILDVSNFDSARNTVGLQYLFPWLQSIDLTMRAGAVQPLDVHPLQVYWATPRRIRLQFEIGDPMPCAICARPSVNLVRRYLTKNYGLNYKGPWRHPLSPYYRAKVAEPFLPVHPQPDGLTYRHWLGWSLGTRRAGREIIPAAAVHAFLNLRVQPGQVRLWAFGYDMDNMKARCWYEATYPLFALSAKGEISAESAESLGSVVDLLVGASESVVQLLRWAIRDAWFGNGEARGDLGFVDAAFWNRTQQPFFTRVEQAAALCRSDSGTAFDETEPLRRGWIDLLRRTALLLFAEMAASGTVEAGNPIKLAAAHRELRRRLYDPKLLEAIGVTPVDRELGTQVPRAASRKPKRTNREIT